MNCLIRQSTDADLQSIHTWLTKQKRDGVTDSFRCNWKQISTGHECGMLLVAAEPIDSQPVGFQLGGLITPGILEVRKEWRGKGIGRQLVEYCASEAMKLEEPILRIQCHPATSLPFWNKMGFTVLSDNDRTYAFRVIETKHRLPSTGRPIDVSLQLYVESKDLEPITTPYSSQPLSAVITRAGIIHLEKRAVLFDPEAHRRGPHIVEIKMGKDRGFIGNPNNRKAYQLGVRRCANGYFVDRLFPKLLD